MKRVYFIRPVGLDGPIKIGCSFSPEGRRRTLDTWSPFALEIIAEIEGDFTLEHRFHALFADTHQRREWFGVSKRLTATIAAINDGTFDIHTLPAPLVIAARGRTGKGARASEWNPGRRFSVAFNTRLTALRNRGMPMRHDDGHPYFSQYTFDGLLPDEQLAFIARCEAFAAEMTSKYGHDRMRPVTWKGEKPRAPEQAAAA